MIIGVTNPFFAKLLHQWPHVIRVDDDQERKSKPKKHENFLLVDHDEENLSVNELDDDSDLSSSPQTQTTIRKKIPADSKPFKPVYGWREK